MEQLPGFVRSDQKHVLSLALPLPDSIKIPAGLGHLGTPGQPHSGRGIPGVSRRRTYSKLVAAPLLDLSHLSKSAWLSTIRKPPDMAEWPLPQSCAQLIW